MPKVKKPRKPTAKAKLVKSLREAKKEHTQKLREINRDLNSLTRRKKYNA